jgi:hypothetical protein
MNPGLSLRWACLQKKQDYQMPDGLGHWAGGRITIGM